MDEPHGRPGPSSSLMQLHPPCLTRSAPPRACIREGDDVDASMLSLQRTPCLDRVLRPKPSSSCFSRRPILEEPPLDPILLDSSEPRRSSSDGSTRRGAHPRAVPDLVTPSAARLRPPSLCAAAPSSSASASSRRRTPLPLLRALTAPPPLVRSKLKPARARSGLPASSTELGLAQSSVSFRSCEDPFDYFRLSSSWTRFSS